jgi:hypothetical protein
LPEGQPPVCLPFEVYKDMEFNDLDFGKFLGEMEKGGIRHTTFDDVMKELRAGQHIRGTIYSDFIAPRRQRPLVKVAISDLDLSPASDGFGARTIMLNKQAPYFERLLFDRLFEVMSGFVEGRYSLKTIGNDDFQFVELADSLIELKQVGDPLETDFNVFTKYVGPRELEELTKRLMAVYEVEVAVVEGDKSGFVMKHAKKDTGSF